MNKNIRFNKKQLEEIEQARKILGIPKGLHGEIPKILRESVKFVIDFNHLVMDDFYTRYSPTMREFIRRKII